MLNIRFTVLTVAAAVLLSAFSITTFSQALPTQKVLPYDMAQTIAQTAVTQCRAGGFRISVTILDASGQMKLFVRDDGAGLATMDVGRRKAYTALISGRPSGEAAKIFAAMKPPLNLEGTISLGGGIPVKVGNETIGAVGVSGAPTEAQDEGCAKAGLAKVADRLK